MKTVDEAIAAYESGDTWRDDDEVVQLQARLPLERVIPVRLSGSQWRAIQRSAQELGLGASTLARMWVLERLNDGVRNEVMPDASIAPRSCP